MSTVSKPAFENGELAKLIPPWPIPHKETEEKLLSIFRSGKWGMCGEYEKKLMADFASFQDAKYSIWMCNGTTTLECALLALGIGPGDEVIVPGVSWVATAEAPIYVGATPVFVDIDPDTLCLDPARVEEAITPRTKAMIPVHLYSAMTNMDALNALAEKHGIAIIEDCAHAHGMKQHGKGAGSLGAFGSFSFQLSKLMTGGEGGCLTTNDDKLADAAFRLSHIGTSTFSKDPLQMGLECHQYRFTDFQAVIIHDQLQHQAEYRAKRQKAAEFVEEFVKDIPSIYLQKTAFEDDLRDYYFFSFLLRPEYLKKGITRNDVFKKLYDEEGISLGTGWGAPIYKFPIWNMPPEKYILNECPVCEDVMWNRLMATLHNLLLADKEVLERWGEGLRRVMLSVTE